MPGTITSSKRETRQVEQANASERMPVVFIHGLWVLPSSWDRWADLFEDAGYAAVTPSWPDDPETVAEARPHPEVPAKKTPGQAADHTAEVTGGRRKTRPSSIPHPAGCAEHHPPPPALYRGQRAPSPLPPRAAPPPPHTTARRARAPPPHPPPSAPPPPPSPPTNTNRRGRTLASRGRGGV